MFIPLRFNEKQKPKQTFKRSKSISEKSERDRIKKLTLLRQKNGLMNNKKLETKIKQPVQEFVNNQKVWQAKKHMFMLLCKLPYMIKLKIISMVYPMIYQSNLSSPVFRFRDIHSFITSRWIMENSCEKLVLTAWKINNQYLWKLTSNKIKNDIDCFGILYDNPLTCKIIEIFNDFGKTFYETEYTIETFKKWSKLPSIYSNFKINRKKYYNPLPELPKWDSKFCELISNNEIMINNNVVIEMKWLHNDGYYEIIPVRIITFRYGEEENSRIYYIIDNYYFQRRGEYAVHLWTELDIKYFDEYDYYTYQYGIRFSSCEEYITDDYQEKEINYMSYYSSPDHDGEKITMKILTDMFSMEDDTLSLYFGKSCDLTYIRSSLLSYIVDMRIL